MCFTNTVVANKLAKFSTSQTQILLPWFVYTTPLHSMSFLFESILNNGRHSDIYYKQAQWTQMNGTLGSRCNASIITKHWVLWMFLKKSAKRECRYYHVGWLKSLRQAWTHSESIIYASRHTHICIYTKRERNRAWLVTETWEQETEKASGTET